MLLLFDCNQLNFRCSQNGLKCQNVYPSNASTCLWLYFLIHAELLMIAAFFFLFVDFGSLNIYQSVASPFPISIVLIVLWLYLNKGLWGFTPNLLTYLLLMWWRRQFSSVLFSIVYVYLPVFYCLTCYFNLHTFLLSDFLFSLERLWASLESSAFTVRTLNWALLLLIRFFLIHFPLTVLVTTMAVTVNLKWNALWIWMFRPSFFLPPLCEPAKPTTK